MKQQIPVFAYTIAACGLRATEADTYTTRIKIDA